MIEDNFRKVVPYVPGEQPKDNDVIKLNTNENPYPPSPSVLDALAKVDNNSFRKYPDPDVTDLVQAIADYHHFKKENVLLANTRRPKNKTFRCEIKASNEVFIVYGLGETYQFQEILRREYKAHYYKRKCV